MLSWRLIRSLTAAKPFHCCSIVLWKVGGATQAADMEEKLAKCIRFDLCFILTLKEKCENILNENLKANESPDSAQLRKLLSLGDIAQKICLSSIK